MDNNFNMELHRLKAESKRYQKMTPKNTKLENVAFVIVCLGALYIIGRILI